MNSWKSIGASECAPPLMTLAIGHGQDLGVGAAEVLEQRQADRLGSRLGVGQRHREDGVGAELGLGLGAVQLEHDAVHRQLVEGVHALECGQDLRRSRS